MTRVYVAGHRGMVGGAIMRRLQARQQAGQPLELINRTHSELDLTNQAEVAAFFNATRPDVVILAAAATEELGQAASVVLFRPIDSMDWTWSVQGRVGLHTSHKR